MKQKTEHILWICYPIFSSVYLIWRIGWTIPYDHGLWAVFFSLVLLFAEMVGIWELMIHFYTVAGNKQKMPLLPGYTDGELPEVDVFVPTVNEPTELLEQTLKACVAMEYDDPSKVHIYLCDDGNREEMRRLASDLGVNYLVRTDRSGAKAGNLNAAMAKSSSPLIVVFDADMRPKSGFLLATVPYFLAPPQRKGARRLSDKIGYIQTPQSFRNGDLFQRVFRAEQYIPNEQDYFYLSLEPARNKTNSVIFGGSNTVLLRKALERAGGFCTDSLTEDFATGIEIQKLGYTCYAIPQAMADGLAPESLSALIRQRIRWARGCIQAGRCTGLLTAKKLKPIQRMSYLSSITYWYAPLKRLIYLITPLLYAVFGITVMRCSFEQMLIFWLPMYLCGILCIRLLSDDIRTVKWTTVYETCLFPFLLVPVLAETFGIKKKEFVVTDKSGKQGWSVWYPLPFLCLIILSVAGIVRVAEMSAYQQTSVYLLLLFWLIYNLYQLLFALVFVWGCRSVPEECETIGLVHDLKRDRFGRTGLFVILIRMISEKRKGEKK